MNDNLQKIKGIANKLKGLTTIGIANISATVISGVFWLYIAALLGTTHYGEISYVIAISGIALTFSLFGSGNALLVYTAKGVKIQPPVYFISLVSFAITSVVLYLIYHNIGLCLLVIGNGVFGMVTIELLGLKLYKKYAQYFIIQRILMTFLAIGLYYLIGYNGIVIGIGLSYFPVFIRVYQVFKDCSKIDFTLLRTHFRFMLTSYVLDISRTFASSTDKIIVAPMLGFALLGNYQLGLQFLSILLIFPAILYNYLVPHDASGIANNRLKRFSVIFSVILVIPSIILSPSIIPILFPKFTEAISVIQIIGVSIIPITISNIYISKFLGNEKIRLVLIGSTIYIIVNIGTIIALGKTFSINGVAISYVISATSEAIYLITVDRLGSKNRSESTKSYSLQSNFVQSLKNITSDLSAKIAFCSIITISVIGLFLRLYNFPYNIPLTLDAFNSYFLYATDTSILGNLPNWPISNNGWALFLSFFFSVFHSNNFLDYMNLQRLVTMYISLLTIIPVYFLCRRFFNRLYSIAGVALFTFEPHMIQNASLGLSDPLFIILVTTAIMLFLRSKTRSTLIAFGIIGLATTVRIEGLFVFFAFSASYFIQNRHERKIIMKYPLGLAIFVAALLPIILLRIRTYGEDFISSRISDSTNAIVTISSHENSNSLIGGLIINLESIVKLGGWSLIPFFIIFVPIGIYLILRKRDHRDLNTILIIMGFMLIPVAIAFSWAQDTRYIYPLFPLFCIVSIFPIMRFVEKRNIQKIIIIFILGAVLFSSMAYLEIKKNDLNHQREAFGIAQQVVSIANGINNYYPEDSYIGPSEIPEKWPVLKNSIHFKTNIIDTAEFDSLESYIKASRDKSLTHLVVDDNKNRPNFIKDVFYHSEKYPYLSKVFESSDYKYKYHIKIYEIKYDIFDKNQTK